MIKDWILLLLGGGIGAALRETFMLLVVGPDAAENIDFLPVFLANMLAALLIGLVAALAAGNGRISPRGKLFLATGMMGGLSTFSTFIWGTENSLRDPATAAIGLFYLVASMIIGFLMVQLGLWLGDRVPGEGAAF